jgi:hypothetical protein
MSHAPSQSIAGSTHAMPLDMHLRYLVKRWARAKPILASRLFWISHTSALFKAPNTKQIREAINEIGLFMQSLLVSIAEECPAG